MDKISKQIALGEKLIIEDGDRINEVELKLQYGADPNTTNPVPLISAVQCGRLQTVKLLLECRANPNLVDSCGITPLMYASSTNSVEIIKLLIQHGANVNAIDRHGNNALSYVSSNNHKIITDLLEEQGAKWRVW